MSSLKSCGDFEFLRAAGVRPAGSALSLFFKKRTGNHHPRRACCNIYRWSRLFSFFSTLFFWACGCRLCHWHLSVDSLALCCFQLFRSSCTKDYCLFPFLTNKQKRASFPLPPPMNAGPSGVTSISWCAADFAHKGLDALQSSRLCFQ